MQNIRCPFSLVAMQKKYLARWSKLETKQTTDDTDPGQWIPHYLQKVANDNSMIHK